MVISSIPILGPVLQGPMKERSKLIAYCDDVKTSVTIMVNFFDVDEACDQKLPKLAIGKNFIILYEKMHFQSFINSTKIIQTNFKNVIVPYFILIKKETKYL